MARERLLAKMQKSASSFLQQNAAGGGGGGGGEEEGGSGEVTPPGDMDLSTSGKSEEGSSSAGAGAAVCMGLPLAPECMACRGSPSAEGAGPLGYAAFCQRSSVLRVPVGGEGEEDVVVAARRQGTVVQLCGHAMHYGCFDAYYASVMESSEAMGHLIYDVQVRPATHPLTHPPTAKAAGKTAAERKNPPTYPPTHPGRGVSLPVLQGHLQCLGPAHSFLFFLFLFLFLFSGQQAAAGGRADGGRRRRRRRRRRKAGCAGVAGPPAGAGGGGR